MSSNNVCFVVLRHFSFSRWIVREGSQYWPPRSPDLTPIDFSPLRVFKKLYLSGTSTQSEGLTQSHC